MRPRHALGPRVWQWVYALGLVVGFFSGLNISNAHPQRYWGGWGLGPAAAWLRLVFTRLSATVA